uniref:Exoribonuclease phosphorolytic domain-containing protein n=1 Tax=Cannabis sativa TaxID=3483 RepID=A0A803Q5S2_CANSA
MLMPPPVDRHLQVIIGVPHLAGDSSKAREKYAQDLQYEQNDAILAVEERKPKIPRVGKPIITFSEVDAIHVIFQHNDPLVVEEFAQGRDEDMDPQHNKPNANVGPIEELEEVDVNPAILIRKLKIGKALLSNLRVDGRRPFDYRNVIITFGKDDGSVEVQLGQTHVMVFVMGQLVQPYRDHSNEGTLSIFTEFSPMADPSFEPGRPTEAAIEVGHVIDRGLRESRVVDTVSLCVLPGKFVWAIRIDLHILDNGRNLVDTANIAALAALMTFRRPECSLGGDDGQEVIVHPPEFDSQMFVDFCTTHEIIKSFSAVAHPQKNGQVKVVIKTLKYTVKNGSKGNWPEELPEVLWSYITTKRTATGHTPFGMAYGYEEMLPMKIELPSHRGLTYDQETNHALLVESLDEIEEK